MAKLAVITIGLGTKKVPDSVVSCCYLLAPIQNSPCMPDGFAPIKEE